MAADDSHPISRLWRWLRRRDPITPDDRQLGVRSVRDNPTQERIDDPRFPSL